MIVNLHPPKTNVNTKFFSQLFGVVFPPEWYTESSFELFMSAERLISASERRTIMDMELFFILGGGLLIILFAVVVAVIVSVSGAVAANSSDLDE